MCGICGFIGKSNDRKASFELATALMIKTETRGEHATGFYTCEKGAGLEPAVLCDKEPVKSSLYVYREVWKEQFAAMDPDLFIGHCRLTSMGGGPEKVNKNNHPHWSEDKRVAMVHNGKIPEYNALKGRYGTNSECDSEILLRMFESAESFKDKEDVLKQEFPTLTPFLAYRLLGLKEIFSRVNYGAMAVAIAERGDDGSRYLWLFRDDERPLHVVDMRKTLGQIFFCSTAEIWRAAVESCPAIKPHIPQDQVIIEFPSFQIWLLANDANEEDPVKQWNIRKFKITKTKFYDWQKEEEEDDKIEFKKPENTRPLLKVITRLGENEELPATAASTTSTSTNGNTNSGKVPNLDEEGRKKKVDDRGKSGGVSAVIPTSIRDGRDPGDETEDERPGRVLTEADFITTNDDQTLSKEDLQSLSVVSPESEGIDMEQFNKTAQEIEEMLSKVKEHVKRTVEDGSLGNKDFSQVMDTLYGIKNELSGTVLTMFN